MIKNRLLLIGLAVILVLAALCFYFREYISLEYLQQQAHYFGQFVQSHYIGSLCVYACLVIGIVALSIPAIGPLALLGGFLFGALPALAVTSLAVPIGVLISYLCIKHFFAKAVADSFAEKRERFIAKLQQYGSTYLLTLNLISIIPSGVISTLAVLANVPLWTFFWTTFVGSFPMLAVYAYAGRTFSELKSISDLFSAPLIIAFTLLALLSLIPMLLKRMNSVHDYK